MTPTYHRRRTMSGRRGGILITAMLLATAIALGLAAYLRLTRTSLQLAHRTYFAHDAANLAEAGLEEALYCFNQLAGGAAPAAAWNGWTLTGNTATRILPPITRSQDAVGVVKVFVSGHDGSNAFPFVFSQATITPFDGSPPVVRVLQFGLKSGTGYSSNGIVALQGLTFRGQSICDSFNSNPTNNPNGPWLQYSSAIARANSRVIVPTGTVSLGNGQILGHLLIGPTVTPPPANQVTGTIQRNFSGTFKAPDPPTAASVSRSYQVGATIPAVLPVPGHEPASDGSFYYFANGATISATTVTAGNKVVIVGRNTSMTSGLTLQGTAACTIHIDGPVSATGVINNNSWAGALQIFTTTTAECSIGNNDQIVACLFAPNANLIAKGGGSTGMLVGYFLARTVTATGHMDFHYDEALQPLSRGNSWQLTQWYEVHSAGDRAALAALTNGFLP